MFTTILYFFTTVWTVIIGIIVFGLMNIWALISLFFPKSKRERIFFTAIPFLTYSLMRYGCLAKIIYQDYRSTEDKSHPGAVLYIANHRSMLDVPLLNTKFPITTLMKFEVLYIPFMTLPSIACGAITVKRTNKDSRKEALLKSQQRLQSGKPVFYFPEGTRSRNGLLKDFTDIHLPLIKIAYKNGIPVQPISIQGTKELLSSPGFIKPFQQLIMTIHPLVKTQDFTDEITFAQTCWKSVASINAENLT